uniref:Uncharacterized protein n=1 Tax=uncultured bacterium contig00070 TaxID=1181551 RepID=A0A806KG42_9BACT|nr:hypothetical protein [uncultured bacterium contig00070]
MNVMNQAFRTTCVPKANRLDALIPNEYIGRKLEITVIPLVEKVDIQEKQDMYLAQESSLDKIWNSEQEDKTWEIL